MELLEVRPLLNWMHDRFIAKSSPANQMALTVEELMASRASLSKGRANVKFAGMDFSFPARAVPCVLTADGGIVTDVSLFCRQLLLGMLMPSLGQRAKTDPMALAELVRAYAMRFFSGASCGGAVYDTKHWYVSPHWLPVPAPLPLAVMAGSIADPVSRTLKLWASESEDGENARKAAKASADPYFALLCVEGQTMLQTLSYTMRDMSSIKWGMSLVQNGPDDTDVVSRSGTLGSALADDSSWMSDAYESLVGSGFIAFSLQLPRPVNLPRFLDRIVYEGEVPWFRCVEKDYKLKIDDRAAFESVKASPFDYKMSYLDMVRGVPLGKPKLVSAVRASPIGGVLGSADFNPTASKSALSSLTLTAARRAYLRSDPKCPSELKWVADFSGSSISMAWIPVTCDAYIAQLEKV